MKISFVFFRKIALILLLGLAIHTSYPSLGYCQNSENELFVVVQKAFEDGFYDVAIRYINQLFTDFPQTQKRAEVNLILGQCYFFKGQYLPAYETFQKLSDSPQFKDAMLFWMGETYLKGSDYKKALEQYEQLVKAYPKSAYAPQAYYSIGWVNYEQGQFEKAQEIFEGFVSKYPTHELTEDITFKLGEIEYNLKHYEETIEHFKKYIETFPNSTRHAESYFYIAESYYYLDDALTANTYYAKVSETAYDNKLSLMAKVSLGWGYLKLKKYSLSQQYFDEALKFSQEKGILTDDVYLGQATLFSEMGDSPKALEAYSQLIATFPSSKRLGEAYLGKANILYQMQKFEEASSVYKEIISKFNADTAKAELVEKSNFGLAWTYLKLGKIDECVKVLEVIKDKTENRTVKISAMTQIADAYQDYNELDKAIEMYDQILRIYSDSLYADYVQYRQGVALLKLEKIDSAILSFQSFLNNFPTSKFIKDVQYYLSVAFFKKGNWSFAKEQMSTLLTLLSPADEFYVEVQYLLGLCDYNLKNFDAAIEIFQKIIKFAPPDEQMLRSSELALAKSFYEKNDVKEALKIFTAIINKYPTDSAAEEAFVWLGEHSSKNNELQEAVGYYTQFLKNFPNSNQRNLVNYQLGQAYKAKGDLDEAVKYFKSITDFTDREYFAKARLAIADIFSKDMNQDEAVSTYRNIIETSPEYQRDAYVKIAEVYKANKQYAQAVKEYEAALLSDSGRSQIKNVELQFSLADSYELSNNSKKATDEYLKIPYLYPHDVRWIVKAYLRVARLFEDSEQWPEAENIYNKVVEYETDELKFAQERLEWIKENITKQH